MYNSLDHKLMNIIKLVSSYHTTIVNDRIFVASYVDKQILSSWLLNFVA